MSQFHRLSLERHLSESSEGSEVPVSPEGDMVRVEATWRSRLEEEVDMRFTPAESTFKQLLNCRLSPQQASAVDLMVGGACDADVARTLGLHRSTISRWRQFHPAVVAELNRHRDSTLEAAADRLRRTTQRALDIIDERLAAIDRPDLQLRASVCLLRMIGIGTRAAHVGATSADQFIDDHARANRREEYGMVDNGERERVLLDLARRDDGARVEGVSE